MSLYAPGTINTPATSARRRRSQSRTLNTCTRPTGSQVFGTTEKVRNMQSGQDGLEKRVSALENAIGGIDITQAEIPPGGVVFMSSNSPPSDKGYPGQWRFLFEWTLPNGSLFLFERLEESNDNNS